MKTERVQMPHQPAIERSNNFEEVALGLTVDGACSEANRCLQCKHKPCVSGCPVAVDIPAFIKKVAEEDIDGAYEIIAEQNSLPAVCGRVCPQENQCEGNCVLNKMGSAISIGSLERFVADYKRNNIVHQNEKKEEEKGQKVAVVGSGPAGLACAGELAKNGYSVTVFEALHTAGGVLVYGIPQFRLPKEIVQYEIDGLVQNGVEIQTNVLVGKTYSVEELFALGYKAVFIGSGAGLPSFMGIPGENLKGVFSANEYLTRINLMKAYKENSATPIYKAKKVAVVGGGNVAMDAARCAVRLGAEVHLVYRRGAEEMPARKEEIAHAIEEGVIFDTLTNPTEILAGENGWVNGLKCVRMELTEPDESGRRKPVPVENSAFVLDVDCVIMAIGTTPNPILTENTKDLETDKWGRIVVKTEEGLTSMPAVYAGGDAVTGAATVILAMGAGKKAAQAISDYLREM